MKKYYIITEYYLENNQVYNKKSLLFYSFDSIDTYVKSRFNSNKIYMTKDLQQSKQSFIKCNDNETMLFEMYEN
tara:strand:+ start:293 stop:514 length:222 start_codon:yes stop_codon:yes gene_type:complete